MSGILEKLTLVGMAFFTSVPIIIGDKMDIALTQKLHFNPHLGIGLGMCWLYFICMDKLFKSKGALTNTLIYGLSISGYILLVTFFVRVFHT